jgi:biotin carboxyl carrier protein
MKWVIRGAAGSHEVEVQRSATGFKVILDGVGHRMDLIRHDGTVASLRSEDDGRSFYVSYTNGDRRRWRVAVGEREFELDVLTPIEALESSSGAAGRGARQIEAPIPGKVVAINVEPGDEVVSGQSLVVLEAMKMENELAAERDGRVTAVHVEAGATVEAGTVLVEVE